MKFYKALMAVVFIIVLNSEANAQSDAAYQHEIKQWDSQRIKSLTADNGWINLAGLFWLKEGKNSFGSGEQNDIVFPAGKIADKAGYFELSGNTVQLFADDKVTIKVNDAPVQQAVVFSPDATKPTVLSHGDLKWTIIKREDKIGIRLRDLKSPLLREFKGINRFEADPAWKIPATLQTQPGSILITNVLGQTTPQKSPGKVSFSIDGKPYTLDALEDDGKLFIIFADASSGETTYPSGRFLTADIPGADGKVILDFNKAYNPPCAFTKFATCPLPPKQNRLPFIVNAGEKYDQHTDQ